MKKIEKIGSVNHGNEYLYIYELFKKNTSSILYIAKDDREIFKLRERLKWLLPNNEIFIFRSWDHIPYDNISPSREIQSERIQTLFKIFNDKNNKIILTSINAIIQKTVNSNFVNNNVIEINKNIKISFDDLIKKIISLGYQRTSLVREKSEFAIRGSIIDIFIINKKNPIRLDFDDNLIEKISEFDKITQQKIREINETIILHSSNEILLNNDALNLFRKNFRKLYSNYRNSIIYNQFSELIFPPGGENFLPLFHKNISNIFEFCHNYKIILTNNFNDLLLNRIENINDFYNARIDNGEIFHLKPNFLYLNISQIDNLLNKFDLKELNEFKIKNNFNFDIKKINNLSTIRKEIDFNFIKKFFDLHNMKKFIICARSNGSLERIIEIFNKNLDINLKKISNYNANLDFKYLITVLDLEESLKYNDIIFLNEKTIFGYNLSTKKNSNINKEIFFEEINKLTKNSILVHSDYGFCRFIDIIKIEINDSFHDCIKLEFADNQKLLLPIENLNSITKYSDDNKKINLDFLGASHWQKRKAEAKNKIKDVAQKLIAIAAKRHNSNSFKIDFNPNEYEKFSSTFPFVETDDQLKVIEDIKLDFAKTIPSDRLIVGDVAFGKTEIIIRAVFLAAKSNVQSLILVPTTLLSRQHFINFSNRLKSFGVTVSEISRFVSNKDKEKIYKNISNGSIDVLIGTHALLNDKILFKKLGLIIYDEEQKLGTQQKEKFKLKSPNAHVISLSATPIPRTLSLSLSGIRDLSLILTAPYERLAVRCFISPFDEITIIEAIKREIFGRKNSVFYVTPRKKDIPFIEKFIKEKLPEIKYVVAHGQLKTNLLQERITKFYNKEVPLLISTNIIENGLDLPHVNTIIVNRSNIFSLSSLYQLKGRVGRSSKRGFAYMTFNEKEMTENARKRLNIINSFEEIGSGFNIASQDLNLRGSGSIIGEEQSGFIKEVGVELYHQMLEEEIIKQKNKKLENFNKNENKIKFQPSIKIPEEIYIPDIYINDLDVKMSIYKRISLIKNEIENNNLISELIDRFGKLPIQVKNLFKLIEIKILCIKYNIEKIDYGKKGILISFFENKPINPEKILLLNNSNKNISIRSDQKLFYDFSDNRFSDKFEKLKEVFKKIH